jgi:hypothetical protein
VVGPDQTLDAQTSTFTADVTRLGCNDGVTGTVNDPNIDVTDDEVVVTFTVSPGPPDIAGCPGNEEAPYQVQLPEPLGDRSMTDGACVDGEARDTSFCLPSGVRFHL